MARVRSEERYPGLWVRLLMLRRLLLVQSQPWEGSAGLMKNGQRIFVCSDPACRAGAKRVRKVSSNADQWCCGRRMDRALYRSAEVSGRLGTLAGATNLDVFICVGCANFAIEAANVDPGRSCPACRRRLVVKFGTSRKP
ncbi:hypothetical protein [Streptomyces sp. NPDC020681]|uniref:hypothetical protein n=1 Tax=Streptomyces sp. NPDC020681 TaxID=3365083 RepID=UPI0037A0BB85